MVRGEEPPTRSSAKGLLPMMERRAHPRAALAAKVEAESEGRAFLAAAADISAGGMLIYTANPLPEGAALQLTFALPGIPGAERTIRVRARVMRVEASTSMGVKFEDLAPDDRAAIEAFTRS
jgi:uncharacterized protein (TIGR02266 family)